MAKREQVNLHFSSVADAMASTRDFTVERNKQLANIYMTEKRSSNWYGMAGGAPAVIASFHKGNKEAEAEVRKFHEQIAAKLPRAVGVNRTLVRGSMGAELDIHAVNRGSVDRAWSSRERRVRRGSSILRLCVDVCGNSGASADILKWRGIAALALCEVMVAAGYSVEIVACLAVAGFTANDYNDVMTATTVIKPRNTPTDIGLLAACIGTAGFFRTVGFCQIVKAADSIGKTVDGSLGHYADVSGVLPVPDKVTQLFVTGNVQNERTAREWVEQSVKLLQG